MLLDVIGNIEALSLERRKMLVRTPPGALGHCPRDSSSERIKEWRTLGLAVSHSKPKQLAEFLKRPAGPMNVKAGPPKWTCHGSSQFHS